MFVLNSKLINGDSMNISISSDSLNYGFSLFETIKLHSGELQLLSEHIDRLNNSLYCLKIEYKICKEKIKMDIDELIDALDIQNGAIKILVMENEATYHTLISYSNRVYERKSYEIGYRIMLSKFKTNESGIFTYHKTSNYANNIIALRNAKKIGFDEVIFENSKEYISEGSLSNIFIVKNNIVYTPSIESGILNGIMRAFVIKILQELNIEIIEKKLEYSELIDADELFLSNSLMNIMPVSLLNDKSYDISKYKIYKKIKKQLCLKLKEDYFG